jgi:glutamine synthetase
MSGNESRVRALSQIAERKPVPVTMPGPLSEIWASDVFNLATMEHRISKNAFKAIKKTIQTGEGR